MGVRQQQAPVLAFPAPSPRYDANNEAQFRQTVRRAVYDTFVAAIQVKTITVTGTSHTAADERFILVDDDTAGSTVTITLPAAAGINIIYHIKKLGTTANVIVDGNASETIDGALTATLSVQFEAIKIVSDGSNWHVV